jgi:ATP/maltotriose-dependent transcriptional regulator MalT/two-component SAPR family response regulator
VDDLYNQRKITCPPLTATHLHRETLVNLVNDVITGSADGTEKEIQPSPYKLILLHAPAGYGKTTLLADFAQQTQLPCCWYMLDYTDTDRMTFLIVLLASIRQCFPNFGSALDPILTSVTSGQTNVLENTDYFDMIVDAFVAALETDISDRFALFLCNYQEINDLPEMNSLISLLLQKLPSQCTLVIESRVIPNLNFARLLAGQMIFGIGVDQLRFTAQQIHQLAQLQGVGPLTDSEAKQLEISFDGWIAGILLGTRLSNIQQFQQSLAASLTTDIPKHEAASNHLFSYVVNEVFKSHQAAYTFLKEVCILQEMPPATCASLLNIPFAEAYRHLQYLEQQNLFVTHNGEGPNIVYICTSVLRKLLCEQLLHEAPERFSHLHQRAAELLSATHDYDRAIYHALEASVNDIAASLIIESSEQMMNQGHAETMARWIDAFPTTITNRYPKLLLIRANIYLRQGDAHSIPSLLETADAAVQALISQASSLDTQNLPALQAEITIIRSTILFRQREYQQSLLMCQQVLDSLPVDEVALRAEALTRLGVCHILLGDFTTGIAHIQKALQLWGRHAIQRQTANGHSVLARAYCLLGNFSLAEHHMSRALACWDKLQDNWGKVDNLVRMGNIKVRQGVFPEAETIFQEALALARGPIHYLRGQAYTLDCLGIFYQRREYYERALEVTEEALALARQIHDRGLIYDTLCDLAMIYLAMGDAATALMLISEVEVQNTSGNTIGYEQALRDLIYGTIYLYQRRYNQAWPYLNESESILRKVGIKQEHLQALLRLASCQLAMGQLADAIRQLETAAPIITICEGYEQLAQLEVRRLPGLSHALKTLPELAHMKALFHLDADDRRTSTGERPFSTPENQSLAQPSSFSSSLSESTVLTIPYTSSAQYTLTILALGEPAVYIRQKPVTHWRMARAMELCFYLLNCGRPMRKETIITALWPEMDEQTTRKFYSTIYYLRQALGGEAVIVAKGGTYALKLDALYGTSVWYDVSAFLDAQAQAKQVLDDQQDAAAKVFYLKMVELYRGDYVQPFYSDWSTAKRDELRRAYLDARQQLALIAWRAEEFDESIIHWQHMLAVDDWLEEAHYGLMRCYARQGKRGLALRQYQRCKNTLEQEFGVAPQASIQNLYQRLMGLP